MKIKLLSTLLFFCIISFSQQISIKGIISFEKEMTDNLAEVILSKQDSIVNSTIPSEDGIFTFTNLFEGTYTIEVKHWGEIVYTNDVDLKEDTDLGILNIASTKEIQQVTVTGKRKLIERKIDRMVFNVENSISATGGDALDALRITPNIKVQNEQISIVGKSSLKVMVNDRIIPLSGDDLVNYLKSISSDNIKSIEVITAPPAKYDAEGNSGLINIVLKTSKKNNWNSYLGGTYKQSKYEFYNENLGFTMNYKKITINSDINFYNGISYAQRDKSFIVFSDEDIHSKFYAKSRLKNRFNGNLGMDYQWTEQFSLGFQSIYNTYDVKYRVRFNEYFNKPTSSILTQTYTAGPSSTNNTYVNVHSQYKLDTLGSKIQLNLDYFKNDRKENFILYSKDYADFKTYIPTQDFSSRDINNFKIYNYSGSLDGEQHFKKIRFEYGVKASHTKITNNAGYYTLVSNDPSNQYDTNDTFEYKENLQAVYSSGKGKITEKWEIQTGLRLETFQRRIFSLQTQEKHKYNSTKLFPSVYLTYNLDENHTLNLNYTRRINRPSYNTLNPFKNRISKGNIISGNPYLTPSYTDNLELNYSWKNNWNTGVYFYRAKDAIDYAYYLIEKEEYIFRKAENCVTENSVGLSQNYTFKTIKWLESYLSVDVYYKVNKSNLEGFKSNNIISANFDINNNLFLNKEKTLYFTLLYQYAFPQYMATKKISSYSNFGVGIKAMFLDKRLVLTLNANDIFKTFVAKIKNDFKINTSKDTLYQYAQYIRFTIKYNLGNSTLKSKTLKSGNEEEKNRTIK